MAMRQVGELYKPIILFNFEGFYDPLMNWLETLSQKNFVTADLLKNIQMCGSAEEIKRLLDMEFAE